MKLVYNLNDISNIVSKQIIPQFEQYKIFTLSGPLGAGKTTLVKEILKQCNIVETITSPTFGYVNTYHNDKGGTYYHFDLYRITSLEDFLAAGFDEFLSRANSWCLIEWPDVISELLTTTALASMTCHIQLQYDDTLGQKRHIAINL